MPGYPHGVPGRGYRLPCCRDEVPDSQDTLPTVADRMPAKRHRVSDGRDPLSADADAMLGHGRGADSMSHPRDALPAA